MRNWRGRLPLYSPKTLGSEQGSVDRSLRRPHFDLIYLSKMRLLTL